MAAADAAIEADDAEAVAQALPAVMEFQYKVRAMRSIGSCWGCCWLGTECRVLCCWLAHRVISDGSVHSDPGFRCCVPAGAASAGVQLRRHRLRTLFWWVACAPALPQHAFRGT